MNNKSSSRSRDLIGSEIPREGKLPLLIVGKSPTNGKFWVRQKLPSLSHQFFLDYFPAEQVVKRAKLKIPNYTIEIELVEFHRSGKSGYWEIRFPGEYTEVTQKEIEEMKGEANTSQIFLRGLATKLENGGTQLGRYAPRKH